MTFSISETILIKIAYNSFDLYSSELMIHKKIRIPKESAIDIMEELGKLDDCIQFVDLNISDFEERKNFGNLIESDEALKNIQIFENMVQLYNSKINKYGDYNSFRVDLKNDMRNMDKNLGSTYFDLIENEKLKTAGN